MAQTARQDWRKLKLKSFEGFVTLGKVCNLTFNVQNDFKHFIFSFFKYKHTLQIKKLWGRWPVRKKRRGAIHMKP